MFGADVRTSVLACFVEREENDTPGLFCIPLKHKGLPAHCKSVRSQALTLRL